MHMLELQGARDIHSGLHAAHGAADGVAHEPGAAAGLLRASRKASRASVSGQDQAGNRGGRNETESE